MTFGKLFSCAYSTFQAISRQLADTVERSKLAVGKLEGSSTIVDEVLTHTYCPVFLFLSFCVFCTKVFHTALALSDVLRCTSTSICLSLVKAIV